MREGSDSSNPVNPYNAASDKTAAARRSYQQRKKLAKRAGANQAWAGLDQASMIGQWMSAGRSPASTKNQRPGGVLAKGSKVA
jgi:hypothetical protein